MPTRTPAAIEAHAALTRLTTAYGYLAVMLEPGTASRTTRTMTPARRARLARLTRAERADQAATIRAGLAPTGASPAPIVVPVSDAQVVAETVADDMAWRAASALRARPMLRYNPIVTTASQRFRVACGFLRVALDHTDDDLTDDIGHHLTYADRMARAAANLGDEYHDLHVECPVCGRRSIKAETSSTDRNEWTAFCDTPTCRCRGIDCACKRWGRVPGRRHVWPASEFGQLAVLLDAARMSA